MNVQMHEANGVENSAGDRIGALRHAIRIRCEDTAPQHLFGRFGKGRFHGIPIKTQQLQAKEAFSAIGKPRAKALDRASSANDSNKIEQDLSEKPGPLFRTPI
jgi:hypothetical protein